MTPECLWRNEDVQERIRSPTS